MTIKGVFLIEDKVKNQQVASDITRLYRKIIVWRNCFRHYSAKPFRRGQRFKSEMDVRCFAMQMYSTTCSSEKRRIELCYDVIERDSP